MYTEILLSSLILTACDDKPGAGSGTDTPDVTGSADTASTSDGVRIVGPGSDLATLSPPANGRVIAAQDVTGLEVSGLTISGVRQSRRARRRSGHQRWPRGVGQLSGLRQHRDR